MAAPSAGDWTLPELLAHRLADPGDPVPPLGEATRELPPCHASALELVNRVRGYEFEGYERTVDSHVKNLRRKLGPAGNELVETVVGVGYRLGWNRDR